MDQHIDFTVEFSTEDLADILAKLDLDSRWTGGSYQERADLLIQRLREVTP